MSLTLVQKERLMKGGRLFVVPFYPGEGVAASDEFDHLAMEVVAGIITELKPGASPLVPVGSQDAGQADFVLRGAVTRQDAVRVFRHGWRRPGGKFLAVSGTVVSRSGQDVLLTFSDEIASADPAVEFNQLGEKLGREIGQAIVSALALPGGGKGSGL